MSWPLIKPGQSKNHESLTGSSVRAESMARVVFSLGRWSWERREQWNQLGELSVLKENPFPTACEGLGSKEYFPILETARV